MEGGVGHNSDRSHGRVLVHVLVGDVVYRTIVGLDLLLRDDRDDTTSKHVCKLVHILGMSPSFELSSLVCVGKQKHFCHCPPEPPDHMRRDTFPLSTLRLDCVCIASIVCIVRKLS